VSVLALEINDAGIVVAEPSRVLAIEPGYAFVADGEIVTGNAAYAQARLRPRQVSNRYWSTLSAEAGTAGVAGVASAAELALAQLKALWERFGAPDREAVLVVPGSYRREQLGLMLGLAQECAMPVRGIVDTAAAASARPYPDLQLLHVDAGLHHVAVTVLDQDRHVAARPEQQLADVGIASLTDSWANRVAELFVLATRFDPLHQAESEQALYDRLPQWLARLHAEDAVELVLPHGGEEFRVVIERDQMLGVAAGFYRALVQLIAQSREAGRGLVVQVSDRLTALPGLAAELGRLDDARIVRLQPGQGALGALASIAAIEGGPGQVKFLRRLPWRDAPDAEPPDAPAPAAPSKPSNGAARTATHVVYRGIAYPIDGEGLVVGREGVAGRRAIVLAREASGVSRAHCEIALKDGEARLLDLSRHGTFVNEKRVPRETVLKPADVIRIGSPGEELGVIALENRDGA
jgi:FHA domain